MTDEQWAELGRRAVACRGWRWLPGMSLIRRKTGPAGRAGLQPTCLRAAFTGGHPCDPFARVVDVERLPQPCPPDPHWVPDLRDPATVGCLLALVRQAVEPERAPGDWPMVCSYQNAAKKWGIGAWLNESGKATFAALVLPTYDTEAAALVAALESAS